MEIAISLNFCQFQGQTFLFPDGLPMGGPPSSIVVEVFMCQVQPEILDASQGYSRIME